ncbi:flavodoxin domain-containing protein [Streptomyces sp. KLOTTS4A1]|uniref:flavodoxin domain-containing protein n=1 Tax=Streptomyces sp. KLOTTS4A1 TaxID=3390996 RepID=UPI0039F55B33
MSGKKVLVAYGSKYGSTAEIASRIGAVLGEHGHAVEVREAGGVRDLAPYDAVVLGGALYVGRWHRAARRFARRHRKALRATKVWLFSSGPLNNSAPRLPPEPGVMRTSLRLHSRGHTTFGGRLDDTASGWPARRLLAAGRGGDFRDFDAVTAWAENIARELEKDEPS